MTTTKERPILFSPEMLRAILDGRKTETRRVVKPQPEPTYEYGDGNTGFILDDQPMEWNGEEYWRYGAHWGAQPRLDAPFPTCPYGAPGDVLWVRETWRPWSWHEGMPTVVEFKAGGPRHECHATRMEDEDRIIEWEERVWLSVQDELDEAGIEPDEYGVYHWDESSLRWRPSIHMPRWACRLRLEVEDVRVERLHELQGADAVAEGMEMDFPGGHNGAYSRARDQFVALWDSINADRGFPWEENPWVWVVKFQPTEET